MTASSAGTPRALAAGEAWSAEAPLVPAWCDACSAGFLVPTADVWCPACGRDRLDPGDVEVVGEPERVVPFLLDADAALRALCNHVAHGGAFLRGDLDAEALRAELRPVWWPEWLVDADLDGAFSLEVGFDYQVKSTRERSVGGRWESIEEVETKVRWEPRVGRFRRRLHDAPAPGLARLADWLRLAGLADRGHARPVTPADLRGVAVRLPDLPPASAWPAAREALTAAAGRLVAEAAAAPHHRDLTLRAAFDAPHWTWQLLPAWTTSYDDGTGQRWILVVNGHTGAVRGVLLHDPGTLWLVWGGVGALGLATAAFGAVAIAASLALTAVGGALGLPVGIVALGVGGAVALGALFALLGGLRRNRERRALQPPGPPRPRRDAPDGDDPDAAAG